MRQARDKLVVQFWTSVSLGTVNAVFSVWLHVLLVYDPLVQVHVVFKYEEPFLHVALLKGLGTHVEVVLH